MVLGASAVAVGPLHPRKVYVVVGSSTSSSGKESRLEKIKSVR